MRCNEGYPVESTNEDEFNDEGRPPGTHMSAAAHEYDMSKLKKSLKPAFSAAGRKLFGGRQSLKSH